MSSEYSIHLGDKPIEGRVYDLGGHSGIMITVEVEASDNADAAFRLFIDRDRLLETTLLFHKISQDLAALLPDVDACCRCVPGTPDDQCARHGFGAFKLKTGVPWAPGCPLCDEPSPNGEVHSECASREQCAADSAGEARREPTDTIPHTEEGQVAAPPTVAEMGYPVDDPARCSGCGGLLVHNTGCLDTIPREEAAEHVEPPHRYG